MKPEDLPGACARTNCARSETLRAASVELRIVAQNLRAEARELLATSAIIRDEAENVMDACIAQRIRKPTGSPQAVHSLSTEEH